jgi:hypothetical protein
LGYRRGTTPFPVMRFTPKDIHQLIKVLDDQAGERRVEADGETGITEKTVDELRARATWPSDLVVTLPRENYPEAVVKISRSS